MASGGAVYRFFPASQKKKSEKKIKGLLGFSLLVGLELDNREFFFTFNFVLLSPHPSCCMREHMLYIN